MENNPELILESERLLFRPHIAADMENGPEAWRYVEVKPPKGNIFNVQI